MSASAAKPDQGLTAMASEISDGPDARSISMAMELARFAGLINVIADGAQLRTEGHGERRANIAGSDDANDGCLVLGGADTHGLEMTSGGRLLAWQQGVAAVARP